MTRLTIEVPDDVAVRVANEAAQRGLAPEMLVGQVVTKTFSPGRKLGFIGLGHSGRGDFSQRLTQLRQEVADEKLGDERRSAQG